ncbi:translation initiation factor IF-2 [Buchnera aphidicola]|uniref:Translation initiation factor IF-2 n=1 Tax=Buchnera aphidicola (Anoecia oenotherae) TaxID=1241833 RepID=A0A4D6XRH5_9GAMM|nr:translation initiation factor IF-2 [Buchnera aphidicola]QCI19416.1 translation initiation factor IF-2 [Buchnera aphidicola (Anoecia oenotherae)]
MNKITLNTFSQEVNLSIDRIIQIFKKIGIVKNNKDHIDYEEKIIFLKFIKNELVNQKNTFTLKRKVHSILNISNNNGKIKSVNIEFRRKQNVFDEKNTNNITKNEKKSFKKRIILDSKKNQNDIIISKKIINNKKNNTKKTENIFISDEKDLKKLQKCSKKNFKINKSSIITRKKNIDDKINKIKKNKIEKNNNSKSLLNINKFNINLDENNITKNSTKIKKKLFTSKKNKKNLNNIENKNENKKNTQFFSKNKDEKEHLIPLHGFKKPLKIIKKNIIIREKITIHELSNKMATKKNKVIQTAKELGISFKNNEIIDQDTAQLIAEEMGHKVIIKNTNYLEESLLNKKNFKNQKLIIRPPIVTIMGHVDHGKTTLLDSIRKINTVDKEAGGITQRIGAYNVKVNKTNTITFLDTPGHAAFTAMRARGANVTDIVVLIVAADDGVKPQTIEAIQHAKAAKSPIIIAINKIDKSDSNPKKIQKELIKYNIVSEKWGGETMFVKISSKTGEGIPNLLDSILLQAEMLELKVSSSGLTEGIVLESFLDKGLGPVATILIKEGMLKKGDIVLCGCTYGKIKVIKNEVGRLVKHAKPSIPVQIFGLSDIPISGDKINIVENEKQAREIAVYRQKRIHEYKLSKEKMLTLDTIFNNLNKKTNLELNIVLKSDTQGSLEAIKTALQKVSTETTKIKIIGSGIGGITETDVSLAIASKSIIIGFNVRANSSSKKLIQLEKVDIRYYSVIYDLLDAIKISVNELLIPKKVQKIIGLATVRNIFKSPKFGIIAGCMVTSGTIKRHCSIHILRDSKVIYTGELESLRRFKDDVAEVRNGVECGIGVKNYNDIRVNDIIEVFKLTEKNL